MTSKRYTDEFKIEAVKQITERNYSVYEVTKWLGCTTKSLYAWVERYGNESSKYNQITDQQKEIRDLKAQLRRTEEERDILKKAAAYFAKESL